MSQIIHPVTAFREKALKKSPPQVKGRVDHGIEWDELQRALHDPSSARPETMLTLQPLVGNRAVLRMIGSAHPVQRMEEEKPAPQARPVVQYKSMNSVVQRWNPERHPVITGKAFLDNAIKTRFDPKTAEILKDRSPDMDYIQDQQEKMGKGIAESSENIESYKNLSKQYMVKRDPAVKRDLDRMWRENELHRRDPNYMRMHGEGGLYQKNLDEAAGINQAVTTGLVNKAAGLYNSGSKSEGIETLGDALHQAEDRGAHSEGVQGEGHDARQTIRLGDRIHAHRKKLGTVPFISDVKPFPDFSDTNQAGARTALEHAQDVLLQFANKVRNETISADPTFKRHAIIKGIETTSKGKATWLAEHLVGSVKTGSYVNSLVPNQGRQAPADMPTTEESTSALNYYTQSLEQQKARDQFREWQKPRLLGGLSRDERIKQSQIYFREKMDPLTQEAKPVAQAILTAYRDEFGSVLQVKPRLKESSTQNQLEYEMAKSRFSVWHRWRIQKLFGKPGGLSKNDRIKRSQDYYRSRVIPWLRKARWMAIAIKTAYQQIFNEPSSILD